MWPPHGLSQRSRVSNAPIPAQPDPTNQEIVRVNHRLDQGSLRIVLASQPTGRRCSQRGQVNPRTVLDSRRPGLFNLKIVLVSLRHVRLNRKSGRSNRRRVLRNRKCVHSHSRRRVLLNRRYVHSNHRPDRLNLRSVRSNRRRGLLNRKIGLCSNLVHNLRRDQPLNLGPSRPGPLQHQDLKRSLGLLPSRKRGLARSFEVHQLPDKDPPSAGLLFCYRLPIYCAAQRRKNTSLHGSNRILQPELAAVIASPLVHRSDRFEQRLLAAACRAMG